VRTRPRLLLPLMLLLMPQGLLVLLLPGGGRCWPRAPNRAPLGRSLERGDARLLLLSACTMHCGRCCCGGALE
jgi:hypothetical protein